MDFGGLTSFLNIRAPFNCNIEIEFRLSNVSEEEYKGISALNYTLISSETFVQTNYKSTNSSITYRSRKASDGKITYESKSTSQSGKVSIGNRIVTYAYSQECACKAATILKLPIYDIIDKTRMSYVLEPNSFYRIDTTKSSSQITKKVWYEIELEITNRTIANKSNIVEALTLLINGLSTSVHTGIHTNPSTNVPRDMHSDIDTIRNTISTLLGTQKDIFPHNKPVRLSSNSISTLYGYCYTWKSNGKRIFVYISPNGSIYSVHNRVDVMYESTEPSKSVSDSYILDCEYKSGKVIVFDCLVFKGKSVMNQPFTYRLRCAQWIAKQINVVPLTMKRFYFDWKYLLSIASWYEIEQNDTNDGIIFYHTLSTYRDNVFPIYKYKRLITNDFIVLKDKTGTYRFHVNDRNKYVPFTYHNMDDSINLVPEPIHDNMNGKIYETKWNVSTDRFDIIKERKDKTKPNSIFTAQDNFKGVVDDVISLVTLQETLKTFHYDHIVILPNSRPRTTRAISLPVLEGNIDPTPTVKKLSVDDMLTALSLVIYDSYDTTNIISTINEYEPFYIEAAYYQTLAQSPNIGIVIDDVILTDEYFQAFNDFIHTIDHTSCEILESILDVMFVIINPLTSEILYKSNPKQLRKYKCVLLYYKGSKTYELILIDGKYKYANKYLNYIFGYHSYMYQYIEEYIDDKLVRYAIADISITS